MPESQLCLYTPYLRNVVDTGWRTVSSFYYLGYDTIEEDTRSLHCQGISAFGVTAPTYRIALEKDAPVIVWDFHFLLVMVQMCFSFMPHG